MWSYDSVFYQISTLGFCGAPTENDGVLAHRIKKSGRLDSAYGKAWSGCNIFLSGF